MRSSPEPGSNKKAKKASIASLIKLLGQTGINVMMRIMGLIVMVIAVEFFFSGLKPILQDIFKL
jgi:multiple antibiotic resistance protein